MNCASEGAIGYEVAMDTAGRDDVEKAPTRVLGALSEVDEAISKESKFGCANGELNMCPTEEEEGGVGVGMVEFDTIVRGKDIELDAVVVVVIVVVAETIGVAVPCSGTGDDDELALEFDGGATKEVCCERGTASGGECCKGIVNNAGAAVAACCITLNSCCCSSNLLLSPVQ